MTIEKVHHSIVVSQGNALLLLPKLNFLIENNISQKQNINFPHHCYKQLH